MKLITYFDDGTYLCYGKGKFDDYCVYYKNSRGRLLPPLDKEYFGTMLRLARKYGSKNIYDDFVKLYDRTGKSLDNNVFAWIKELSQKYGEDSLTVEKTFSILYMGMLAEELKEHAIIGKRMKRLGLHNLLIAKKSIDYSTNFMKNMKWREVDRICNSLGF